MAKPDRIDNERASDSAGQSGDTQGIRKKPGADSESVEELLEEGNAFEAGIVRGVERADGEQGGEVVTHQLNEDDVPAEYDDRDRKAS